MDKLGALANQEQGTARLRGKGGSEMARVRSFVCAIFVSLIVITGHATARQVMSGYGFIDQYVAVSAGTWVDSNGDGYSDARTYDTYTDGYWYAYRFSTLPNGYLIAVAFDTSGNWSFTPAKFVVHTSGRRTP